MKNKLETINKLFEGKDIRVIWNSEKEEYYFSVVDVIMALTNSDRPRKYWSDLKGKLNNEGSELSDKIGQLKMKSSDGKSYLTDVLDTEGIFRLIQSIPSPRAEPFKLWLAKLGRERIDETFDASLAINRAIDIYRKKGYSDDWIEARLKGILKRKELTDVWQAGGINEGFEYGILTNEIYKTWSGMKANEYKKFKGITKESLRDSMNPIEVSLTDLSETVTKELAKKYKPQGLEANKKVAKAGGGVAKIAKEDIEKKLGEPIISKENTLDYDLIE